jgi:hypothetical protein
MRRSAWRSSWRFSPASAPRSSRRAEAHNTPPKWRAKSERHGHIRIWTIHYRAHTGVARRATIVLPAWYSRHNHPRIPLVISPHGRGISGRRNALLFAGLPAVGGFAVISPDGQGRMLENYSWGSPGRSRTSRGCRRSRGARCRGCGSTAPDLRLRRQHGRAGDAAAPRAASELLAGAAAFDAVTDFARQYRSFPRLACSRACQKRLGRAPSAAACRRSHGSRSADRPQARRGAFAARSPLAYVRRIATRACRCSSGGATSTGSSSASAARPATSSCGLRQTNRARPVMAFRGMWRHSAEMRDHSRLPLALATFHLPAGAVPGTHDRPARRAAAGLDLQAGGRPATQAGGDEGRRDRYSFVAADVPRTCPAASRARTLT